MKTTKEYPILFQPDMVRAIMTCKTCGHISIPFPCEKCGSEEFVKTLTQRIIKPQPRHDETVEGPYWYHIDEEYRKGPNVYGIFSNINKYGWKCPYGPPGSMLWVRETWIPYEEWTGGQVPYVYLADYPDGLNVAWKPSIHMPRSACRLTLVSEDAKVAQVQETSEEEAIREGCKSIPKYQSLWNRINKNPKPILKYGNIVGYVSYPWEDVRTSRTHRGLMLLIYGNPWVWKISFRRTSCVKNA